MSAFFIFIFILGILIVVHEFGHFIAARRTGVGVEKFSVGFGKPIWSKKKNNTEYCIGAVPLGGFVKLAGDNPEEYQGKEQEYLSKPPGKRFWILFFGSFLNYVLGFLLIWFISYIGYPTLTTKVGYALEGFGAQEAGIQEGDRITSIDGKEVQYWEDLQAIVVKKRAPVLAKLHLIRGTEELDLDVMIKDKSLKDELGAEHRVGILGITPYDEFVIVRHGFPEAFVLGIKKTLFYTAITYKGLWRMISGRVSVKESVTGPLGIFFLTSEVADLGFVALLHFVAILSISLAIFNLLPLPVLDGGHILLLGIEKLRGKKLSIKAERVVNQVGLTMIISLALFVTYNDILRVFGDKISALFNGPR